jgi:hypothetical protein
MPLSDYTASGNRMISEKEIAKNLKGKDLGLIGISIQEFFCRDRGKPCTT